MFEFVNDRVDNACIKVVGVGGAGGNAVNRMIDGGLTGVEFIAINTDNQALQQSQAPHRIQIGDRLTQGLGSGGIPMTGRAAIQESQDLVAEAVDGANMVFVTAGMGGGTGTGAAPVVAETARAMGALTVGIVTKPFEFEGRQRLRHAEEGLEELREAVDTLIVIPNQRLLAVVGDDVSLLDSFRMADEVLLRATRGISELITVPALINLDFADVRTVMAGMGDAIMGTGEAIGEGRAIEATNQAISSPLLEDVSIAGARGVLISFTGGRDLSLREVSEAANLVCETAGPDAHIIFGAMISEEMEGNLRVTVVATGVGSREPQARRSIPVEKRVQEPQPVAPTDDWDRPAFRRREGFLPRWKSGQNAPGNPAANPGANPNMNQQQETKNRQEVKNRLAERPKTKSGRDDLDRPTFLRAHAD